MTLTVRRIQTLEEFAALEPAWARIAAEGGAQSPFLSHDWFWCCWRAAEGRQVPEALVVEDRSGPVAAVPLAHWRERRHGLPVRCVGFLAGPDTPATDVVAVGEPGPILDAVLEHLGTRSDWDLLRLQKVPSASPTLKAVDGSRLAWVRGGTLPSPYVDLSAGWSAFWKSKSQRFKKTVRNTQNRIERAGRVTIEEHRQVEADAPVLREAIEVTRRSWKADRQLAIANMPGMLSFFTELTPRASRRGWLGLWVLRLDGRVIAMEYQLQANGTVHALRADFDAACRELSPGTVLNAAIVRALCERSGMREYDMGPGLNDYKLHWATGSHETVQRTLYRPTLYGRLLRALDQVVIPSARRLRERLA